MPRVIDQQELEKLFKFVFDHEDGVTVAQVCDALGLESRRAQRWLLALIKADRVIKTGTKGLNVKYHANRKITVVSTTVNEQRTIGEAQIYQLSQAGKEIQQLVSSPLANRTPVGYQRKFLDQYKPNKTFYLSDLIRAELHRIGAIPQETQPAGTYARHILQRLLIDLSWNSSRLEGNTYSLLETERLIVSGEQAQGKDASETQMVLNHKAAIEFLVEDVEEIGFNPYTIRNLHALLSDNLLLDPEACGRLRNSPVGISESVYIPSAIPQLLSELFEEVLDKASKIIDPFEQAFFAMVHLSYLQAFDDVNKRVARLSCNIPLIRNNLCPLSFVDMPYETYIKGLLGVYELNRVDLLRDIFVWAYQRSVSKYAVVQQSLGEPDHFKLKYRTHIIDTVKKIIHEEMNKNESINFIRKNAEQLNEADRAKFIEVVENELMGLHEGNISRYRVRLSEFNKWHKQW